MNWDAIGALAELFGAVAVVATLLVLVKQIRANSVMIENATAQNASEAINAWARQLTGNSDLYRVYRTGLVDDTQLDKEERGLFDLLMFQSFTGISSTWLQYRNAGLSEQRWESELRIFEANLRTPGGRASWNRQKAMLDASFLEEMEHRYPEAEAASASGTTQEI